MDERSERLFVHRNGGDELDRNQYHPGGRPDEIQKVLTAPGLVIALKGLLRKLRGRAAGEYDSPPDSGGSYLTEEKRIRERTFHIK